MAKQLLLLLFNTMLIWQMHLISSSEMRRARSSRRVLPAAAPEDDESAAPSACFENFQVSESTIIRTQDSRSLGAKYLNETELPSKEECLQWCCDTNDCNVAVYEEKNKGSCYIFDCSPFGDYKCRFTSHNHYISAVLKVNRHSYDLGKWAVEAKHEEELNKLRVEEMASTPPPTVTPPPPPQLPTTTAPTTMATQPTTVGATQIAATSFVSPSALPTAEQPQTSEREQVRRCTRFQFECRNTSECIAIYNACDGIPQCSDASDESSELGCPMGNSRHPPTIKASKSESDFQLNPFNKETQPSFGESAVDKKQMESLVSPTLPPSSQKLPYDRFFDNRDFQQPQHQLTVQQQLQEQKLLQQQLQQEQFRNQQQFGKSNSKSKNFADNHLPASVFAHKNGGLLQSKANYEDQLNSNNNYQRPLPPAHGSYIEPYAEGTRDESSEVAANAAASYDRRGRPPPGAISVNYGGQDYDNGGGVVGGAAGEYWPRDNDNKYNAFERPRMAGDRGVVHESGMAHSYSHGHGDGHRNNNGPPTPNMTPYDSRHANGYIPNDDYSFHDNIQANQLLPPEQKVEHGNHDVLIQPMEPATRLKSGLELNKDDGFLENSQSDKKLRRLNKIGTIDEEKLEVDKIPNKQAQHEEEKQLQKESAKPSPPTETPPPPEPPRSKEVDVHSHAQLKEVNLEMEVQSADRAGETSGAVLALTLGLTITGVLLVLIGCRLRMVRRHLRRGRAPYAHDADYLVNGMYL